MIDGKFLVDGLCSSSGGMGGILFVTPLGTIPPFPIVLKFCKSTDEEHLKRFRREVRLLGGFKGNSHVVQVWDQNLDVTPPYFVMKYYADGDLLSIAQQLRTSLELQESCFLRMIDCVQELHVQNKFHRDIKPQNFLREGEELVVSDLGLSTEIDSITAFTTSSIYWGTLGYIPPEFQRGGFKHADVTGDIYMLGKAFYVLLTGREPDHLMPEEVSPPLYHVISKCCHIAKESRYQTLPQLREALIESYDVLLGRSASVLSEMFSAIKDRFEKADDFDEDEISAFIERLAIAPEDEQNQIVKKLPRGFFFAISQPLLARQLDTFLGIYENFVEGQDYGFEYAETIASSMRRIVKTQSVLARNRARSIDLAILAAFHKNRWAAMDICREMVQGIVDEDLALHVVSILLKPEASFLTDIESSSCSNGVIQNTIRRLHRKQEEARQF